MARRRLGLSVVSASFSVKKRTRRKARSFYVIIKLSNESTEGLECKLSELEALLTEGDTYKGNAEYDTKYEVEDAEDFATKDEEEEVKEGALSCKYNSLTEGLEYKLSHLEVLLAEGDTDEGHAECDAKNEVYCSEDKAAKYTPKEVAEFFHFHELLEKNLFLSTLQF